MRPVLPAAVQKPLVVTIRTAGEGGEAALDDSTYRDACLALLAQGGVDALDIEWRRHAATVRTLRDAAKQAGAAALPSSGVIVDFFFSQSTL